MKNKNLVIFQEEAVSATSLNLFNYFNFIKKPACTVLVFLFALSPALQFKVLASEVSSEQSSSAETQSNLTASEENTQPQLENEQSVTNDSEGLSQSSEESSNPPTALLSSTPDPDPRIDNGEQKLSSPHSDETSGALIFEYPIKVPPGRGGFQPDLKLQYNSNSSNQLDSPFGAGWNVNIPYIERVNKSGVNNLYSTNTTTPVYFSSSMSGELLASTTATSTFVSRVDSGEFLNYQFINNSWLVKDKKGNSYYFGAASSSPVVTSTTSEISLTPYFNDGALTHYYRLESDGTDSKGSVNLNSSGTITYPAGKFGNGISSAALGQLQNTSQGAVTYTELGTAFSVHYWVKFSSVTGPSTQTMILNTNGSNRRDMYVQIDYGGNKIVARYENPSVTLTSSTTPATGNWYMVDVTYDGSYLKLYVNGSLEASASLSASSVGDSRVGTSVAGYYDGSSSSNNFSGTMDDYATFSRALSSTEISDIYNGTSTQPVSVGVNAAQSDPQNSNNVYKWYLDYVLDPNGNQIDYEYYKNDGQVYPASVSYAGNTTSTPLYTIEFNREVRSDNSTSSKTGFGVYTNYRIKDVSVKMQNSLLSQYSLSYAAADNGRKALLSSVTESGISEAGTTTTLPSTLFNYQKENGGWSGPTINYPVTFNYAVLADVNGDKYDDIIYSVTDNSTTTQITYLNNGNNSFATSTSYAPPVVFYGTGTNCSTVLCDKGVRIADVNGDGLVDIIWNINQTYLNTGSGWTASSTWFSPLDFANPDQNYGNNQFAEIGDVNGDGLPDVFKVWNDGSSNYSSVYFNNGHGFGSSTTWSVSQGVAKQLSRQNLDINGDGLTDLIQSLDYVPGGDDKYTAINNASTWATSTSYIPPIYFVVNSVDQGVRIYDINGDGLLDISKNLQSGGTDGYFGTGAGWTSASGWASPIAFASSLVSGDQGTRIADINGDGMADVVQATDNGSGGISSLTQLLTERRVDLLTKISYPEGGSTNVVYKPSGTYKDASNNLLNPNLPFNVDTVYQIVQHDGISTTSTDTFKYKDGKFYYNGPFDKKFAGFGEIEKTDAVGNLIKTFYHQGNTSSSTLGEYQDSFWKIGKPYRVEKYNNANNLIEKTINKWDTATTSLGNGFVKLAQTVVSTYEGDASHKDKAESYAYNNQTGDVVTKVEYGEVTGSDDGTFSDTGTDNFTTTYTYATSSTSSIISLLSSESVVDNSSNKVKEFKLYYDGLNFGKTNKGNITKREDWKTGSSYVDTEKTYNSFGLPLTEKDSRDKTTTYTYDSYNLLPVTVTNPLGHVTQIAYDYSSGKAATTTDPNGNVFVNVYDGLDRVVAQKQPDPAATSTLLNSLNFVYTDSALGFSVKKSVNLDGSNIVDSYIYLDGLGRKKQERVEAEDGQYITKDYAYNNRGLLQRETLPYFSSGYSTTTATTTNALYINYYYDSVGRIATTSNALGTTTNAYTDWQVKVTDMNGKTKDLVSDAYNNLKQVNEYLGASTYSTAYTYDYNRNLTKITDALSNVRNFTYNGLNQRLTAQDLHSAGDGTYGAYAYTYDDAGNLTQSVDPSSQTINYTYDDINRQLTEDFTGQAGTEVVNVYDTCSQGKGRLCTASSSVVNITNTYNALGQSTGETKVISGNSFTTSYSYDRQGNKLTITNPDSSEVKYAYGSGGLAETVQRKESVDAGYTDVVSNIDYSSLSQPFKIEYSNGAITTNIYDINKMFRLVRRLTVLPETGDMMRFSSQESMGFPFVEGLEAEQSMDSVSTGTVDSLSNLEAVPETTENASSSNATEATSTENIIPNSESTDGTSTPESSSNTEPLSYIHKLSVSVYSYTSALVKWFGNMFYSVSKNLWVWVKTEIAYAAIEVYNSTLFSDANLKHYYQLESDGTDTKGSTTLTSYGTVSHIPSKFSNGVHSTTTGQLLNTSTGALTYGEIGTAYTIHFWVKFNSTSTPQVLTMLHNNNGSNRRGMYIQIDYLGSKITHRYDDSSNTATHSSTTPLTNNWYMVDVTFNGSSIKMYINGNLETTTNITPSSISGTQAYTTIAGYYDGTNYSNSFNGDMDDVAYLNRALTAQEIADLYNSEFIDGFVVQDLRYTYDQIGNITQLQDVSETNQGRIVNYTYDDLNRLTNASTTAASTTPFNYSYTYDILGNLLTRVENGTTTTYTYATNTPAYLNPHAVATTTAGSSLAYTYDNNGNLLTQRIGSSTPTSSYTWDYNNRLTQAVATTGGNATSTYSYDPWGQRVKMTVATTSSVTTYYPTKEYNITDSVPTKHIFLPDGTMIATIVGTGTSTTVSYIHTDHLGGANVVTNDTPDVVELTDYYPYGNMRVVQQTGNNEQRKYIGQEYDGSTGLNYLNARYYNGTNAKFISQDPIFLAIGDYHQIKAFSQKDLQEYLVNPQTLNSYSYSSNNPINFSDPSGLETIVYIEKGKAKDGLGASAGHTFIGINRNGTNTIYSWSPGEGNHGTDDLKIIDSQAFFKQQGKDRDSYTTYTFDTSSDQEKQIAGYYSLLGAENSTLSGDDRFVFGLFGFNCTDAVINALKAGGVVGQDFNPKSAWTGWSLPTPTALDKKLDNKKSIWQTVKGWFYPSNDKAINAKKGKYETNR